MDGDYHSKVDNVREIGSVRDEQNGDPFRIGIPGQYTDSSIHACDFFIVSETPFGTATDIGEQVPLAGDKSISIVSLLLYHVLSVMSDRT